MGVDGVVPPFPPNPEADETEVFSLQHQPPRAESHLAPGQLQSEQRQVPQGQAGGE